MATKIEVNEIDPVIYSEEERAWLLENLGKPPAVALRDLPKGVNIRQVKPLLEKLQELEDLQKHENQPWIGFEAVKDAIRVFSEQDAKWAADARRTKRAPRFPSLYSFDGKGRPHLGGPGSDSGQVRTYFDAKGNRIPFAKALVTDWQPEWTAPTIVDESSLGDTGITNNADLHRWECFCGHTETYRKGSRSSENVAKGRMKKHLAKATEEVDRHREIIVNVFGQASV
jgi:hypothetical protein